MMGDDGAHRNAVNKRAASTIIMLCAIAVAAVVLVHKESAVGEEGDFAIGSNRVLEQDVDELMLFQDDDKDVNKAHKHGHPHHEQRADEIVRLGSDPQKPPDASPVDDPVTDDTLAPVHASLRTGHIEHYGQDAYDSNVVSAAGAQAAKVLKSGLPEAMAYKKAQDVATDKVVSDAAVNAEAPAFSRTIKAAAYAAEMTALRKLESGGTAETAKQAAQEAASGLVEDHRAVQMTVPVPNNLEELLANIDLLWGNMKEKLNELSKVVKGMAPHDCDEAKAAAKASQQDMKLAVLAASEHIAKGHHHKKAMEISLMQADAHEHQMRHILSPPSGIPLVNAQKRVEAIKEQASQSKQKSALHHERAKHQAHLAEGFLSLAAKHHTSAKDATLRCKAMSVLAKLGYARKSGPSSEQPMDTHHGSQAEVQAMKAEVQAENAATKQARSQQLQTQKQLNLMETQNKALVSAMEVSISQQMRDAALEAAKESLSQYSGDDAKATASKAAEKACLQSMKKVAKALAGSMSSVAKTSGQDPKDAMKSAILTVLKVGRPLQSGIIKEATEAAIAQQVKSMPVATKEEPKPKHATAAPQVPKSVATTKKAVPPPTMPDMPKATSKVSKPKVVVAAAKSEQEPLQDNRAMQAHLSRVDTQTAKVQDDVEKKTAKENTHKKAVKFKAAAEQKLSAEVYAEAKVKKKIASKAAKENTQKKALDKAKKQQQVAQDKAKTVATAAAVKAAVERQHAQAQAKERQHAEAAAASNMLMSAKHAVRKVSKSAQIKTAAQRMSAAVTAATAKAAEQARERVAAAGGSMQEQLDAAAKAAATASKRAAAEQAVKLQQEAKQAAKGLVIASTARQSATEARHIAQMDSKQAKQKLLAMPPITPPKVTKNQVKIHSVPPPISPKVSHGASKLRFVQSGSVKPKATSLNKKHPATVRAQAFQLALQRAAHSAMHVQKAMHVHNKKAVRLAIRKALQPIISKEITRSASVAAAHASKIAKSQGKDMDSTRRSVMQAAQHATRQTTAQGKRLAQTVIHNTIKHLQ